MTKTNLFMWACALGVVALTSCGIEEPKMTESSSRTMNLLAEVLAPRTMSALCRAPKSTWMFSLNYSLLLLILISLLTGKGREKKLNHQKQKLLLHNFCYFCNSIDWFWNAISWFDRWSEYPLSLIRISSITDSNRTLQGIENVPAGNRCRSRRE